MEHGPVPPHERTWRHPSELAAEEREVLRTEAAPSATRIAAFTTGAFGLLVIGALVLVVTPNQNSAPLAITAATTAPASERANTSSISDTAVTVASARGPFTSASGERAAAIAPVAARATPFGDGRRALVTRSAAAATDGDLLDVVVPSGDVVDGRIIEPLGDAFVVALDERHQPHPIASEMPAADAIVTVLTDPPVTVPLDGVSLLEVDEGTAVLDGDGELVGLCSKDEGRTRLIGVSAAPADATTADR